MSEWASQTASCAPQAASSSAAVHPRCPELLVWRSGRLGPASTSPRPAARPASLRGDLEGRQCHPSLAPRPAGIQQGIRRGNQRIERVLVGREFINDAIELHIAIVVGAADTIVLIDL